MKIRDSATNSKNYEGRHIIIIDDEPHVRDTLKLAIERRFLGASTVGFDNLEDATRYLIKNGEKVDVIICDSNFKTHRNRLAKHSSEMLRYFHDTGDLEDSAAVEEERPAIKMVLGEDLAREIANGRITPGVSERLRNRPYFILSSADESQSRYAGIGGIDEKLPKPWNVETLCQIINRGLDSRSGIAHASPLR